MDSIISRKWVKNTYVIKCKKGYLMDVYKIFKPYLSKVAIRILEDETV